MRRSIGVLAVVVLAVSAGTAGAQQSRWFFGTNNLPQSGSGGDELIRFDFYNPAGWVAVGEITDSATGSGLNGFAGLDWLGRPGQGPLIGSVGFGATLPAVYSIDPTTAVATFIANPPTPMQDLAYRAADGKMYGTDAADQLWVDNTADGVPETLVGAYGLNAVEVGLAFDGAGNLLVHDLASDIIYKGTGAAPGTVAALVNLPFNSNFSQGLYADGQTGYHAAFDGGLFTADNYDFDTIAGTPTYTYQGSFPMAGALPAVEVGDLTPYAVAVIPEPSTFLVWSLLAALGIGTAWRRRK